MIVVVVMSGGGGFYFGGGLTVGSCGQFRVKLDIVLPQLFRKQCHHHSYRQTINSNSRLPPLDIRGDLSLLLVGLFGKKFLDQEYGQSLWIQVIGPINFKV